MIQTRRPRAVVLSFFAVLTLSVAVGAGCSGGGDDDDDDDDDAATTPGPVCTPLASTLTTIQTAIFSPQCALASCHDSVAPAGSLDLSSAAVSRADMLGVLSEGTFNVANIAIVDSGNAAASFLYLKVTGAGGISGNPMPDTGQTLCAEKVDAIEAWINAGAQP